MSDGSPQVEELQAQFDTQHALCTKLGAEMPVGQAQLKNPASPDQQKAYDKAVKARMETLLDLVRARQAQGASAG